MTQGKQLEDMQPGTKLDPGQAKQLAEELGLVISAVGSRRRHILLIHDSLQNTIGMFLQSLGWRVAYEVPYHTGGLGDEGMVFDIVASQEREERVVEVKDVVTTRDLGQVYGYLNALHLSEEKAKVYLGTDILNYARLVTGVIGKTVKELMEREGLGVILADKYLLMVCDNYPQLVLEEMSAFVPSVQPVG